MDEPPDQAKEEPHNKVGERDNSHQARHAGVERRDEEICTFTGRIPGAGLEMRLDVAASVPHLASTRARASLSGAGTAPASRRLSCSTVGVSRVWHRAGRYDTSHVSAACKCRSSLAQEVHLPVSTRLARLCRARS